MIEEPLSILELSILAAPFIIAAISWAFTVIVCRFAQEKERDLKFKEAVKDGFLQ